MWITETNILLLEWLLCLSQFQLGTLSTSPGQSHGISSKNLFRGSEFDFLKLPGARNSTRAGILRKMKLKLHNNSVHQIFTSENKKKVEFFTFFEVFTVLYMYFSWKFPDLWVNFLVLLSHIPYKKSEELSLACLFEVFTGLWLSTPTFCIKGYDYVKHFVHVLVSSMINTWCLKKISKRWGTLNCWFPVQSTLNTIYVCSGVNLCSPFLAIVLNWPCMKVGFDVRISLIWWMRAFFPQVRIPFSFVF